MGLPKWRPLSPRQRRVLILGPLALATLALFIYAVRYVSINEETFWIGLFIQTGLALIEIVIAYFIFHAQDTIARDQVQLTHDLRQRVFGTLTSFEGVYQFVTELIDEANKRESSELKIMAYWLWFGIDEKLRTEPTCDVSSLKAYQSDIRGLLQRRLTQGLGTTIVAYDPDCAELRVRAFMEAVVNWQMGRVPDTPPASDPSTALAALFGNYKADLTDFALEIANKSRSSRFRPLILREHVPMLMFAATDESGWSRGLIYLGEVEALKNGSETGGFHSEDREIVNVIMSQIDGAAKSPSSPVAGGISTPPQASSHQHP